MSKEPAIFIHRSSHSFFYLFFLNFFSVALLVSLYSIACLHVFREICLKSNYVKIFQQIVLAIFVMSMSVCRARVSWCCLIIGPKNMVYFACISRWMLFDILFIFASLLLHQRWTNRLCCQGKMWKIILTFFFLFYIE